MRRLSVGHVQARHVVVVDPPHTPASSESSNVRADVATFDSAVTAAAAAPPESRSATAVCSSSSASWTACTSGCNSAPAESREGGEIVLNCADRGGHAAGPLGNQVDVPQRLNRGAQRVLIRATSPDAALELSLVEPAAAVLAGAPVVAGAAVVAGAVVVAVDDESSLSPHEATRTPIARQATNRRAVGDEWSLRFIGLPRACLVAASC